MAENDKDIFIINTLAFLMTSLFTSNHIIYVTQRELMRLFEGDIKTDILISTYCSISKEHFYPKTIFISHSYQKLQII